MTFKFFPKIPRESRRIYISAITLTICTAVLLQTWAGREIGYFINKQIFYPFVFSARSKLITKSLDPRIKIFAFDDSTVAYKKSTDLSLPEWADVFESLTQQKNVSLLIDKLFDGHPSDDAVQKFSEKMASMQNARMAAITFIHPEKIRFRNEIDASIVDAMQNHVFRIPIENPQIPDGFRGMTLYGARSEIINKFQSFGFANYNGDGFIAPIAELKSKQVVPHAALSLFEGIDPAKEGLKIQGKNVPTNKNGKILVNFFEPSIYRKATLSMVALIARVQSGADIPVVKPGDFVVVLPAMYTGHTDFVNSPYGEIPGGFHLVALLNSVLTNDWIEVVDDPGFFVILSALLGIGLALVFSPSLGMLAVLTFALVFVVICTLLFVYFNVAVAFVLPGSAILMGGLCGISLKIHSSALEEARKNRELEVAALVQRSFFPEDNQLEKPISSCKSVGISESASECGGDWWGSIRKNHYTYHFIADAIGHGVPAALITSIAYTVSKALELEIGRALDSLLPSDLLTVINRVLVSIGSPMRQMTFYIVRIHDLTGECVYANAANPPPYWLKKSTINIDGTTSVKPIQLTAVGNVLGDHIDSAYENHATTLADGDKIVMFTDGLFENRTSNERSQLGKTWLKATIQRHAGRPIEDFAASVWRSYKFATGTTRPDDDASLLVIEFDRKNMTSS